MRFFSSVLVVLCLFCAGGVFGQAAHLYNGIAAIVNDEVITHLDIDLEIEESHVDLEKLTPTEQKAVRKNRLLERVLYILQEQDTKKSGIALTEEDLLNRMNDHIEGVYKTRAAFLEWLREQGETEDEWKQEYRRELRTKAWIAAKISRFSDPSVTPNEMRHYYKDHREDFVLKNEVKLQVIQVYFKRSPARDRLTKQQSLMGLRAKLGTGADFAVLARKHNEHAATRDKAGMLGWVNEKSDAVPEKILRTAFEFSTRKGLLPRLIESGNSFWLVDVLDRREARVISFSEAQFVIRQIMRQDKHRRARKFMFLDLVSDSYIYPRSLKKELESMLHYRYLAN